MRAAAVSTRVLTGFDDPTFGRVEWNQLLSSGDTNSVFLTWEWQRTWWQSFGRGQLLLILAEREGQPVALAPFFADSRMIYQVGSGGSDYLDFIGDVGDVEVLDALLVAALQSVPDWLGLEFFMIPDGSRTGARLAAAAGRLDLECLNWDSLAAPALNLAANPGAAHTAARKKSLLRHENYFRREGELQVEHIVRAEDARIHLREFFMQHVARWSGSDSPSLFLDPAQCRFYENVADTLAPPGWLRFTRLTWNGANIAFHFGFMYNGTWMWYKPSFDPALSSRSPGEVLLRQLLLAAHGEGASVFDFGIGDEAFKRRFATDTAHVSTWGIYPRKRNGG
jgi:CelD/BcsL family acetyltransferase involved in cellulose biosynthesis